MLNNKLLSICIPTYNRCEILDQTLMKLFTNPDFDETVIEVIVSDNCSIDDTCNVVSKYPLVRYFRNESNIKDRNFSKVLGYATGSYIRLFNDTLVFKEGALSKLLQRIEEHLEDNCNLFFYENMFLHKNSCKILYSKRMGLKTVSFMTTWILNFGVWRKDFVVIEDKNRHAERQFAQVDWFYRILANKKKTIIYFDSVFTIAQPGVKGGYNIWNTFINNYLFIIKNEGFSPVDYEIEKFRLCKYFIYPWLNILLVQGNKKFNFDIAGVYKVLLKKYWYEFYLYPMLVLIWFKKKIHF
jgi:abequosyltransferase